MLRVGGEGESDGEQTERCWCLFSLWLVVGDCSQHKHMPSWLTHFLLHSTSQCWATQSQDTTARCVCIYVCICMHAHTVCMLTALVVCKDSHYICVAARTNQEQTQITKNTFQLKVKEGIFHLRLWGRKESGLFPSDSNICGLTGINTIHLLTRWPTSPPTGKIS